MTAPAFLADFDNRISYTLPAGSPFQLECLALGQGQMALEVLIVKGAGPPSPPRVRTLWKERNQGRAAPLLLVVLFDNRAVLCGPAAAGNDPPVHVAIERGQAEHLCREALDQPDRHAAHRYLRDALPALVDSPMPGVRNEGLLATHELARGARKLPIWDDAGGKASPLLARREQALLKGLGFKIEPHDNATSILRAGPNGKKLAVAVLLRPGEAPEVEADRFAGLSPVSYALTVADRESLPYLVVSQATKLRLYPVRLNVGVGRRGRTETFVEVHPGHLRADDAAYLWLLFSAEALAEGGSLDLLLENSKRFAGELAVKLRERIYGFVVPQLAQGLANARQLKKPTAQDLAETYQMAMTVLFRLLFIAYAEDKDLLPYRFNGLYEQHSLKTMARHLVKNYPHGLPADESPFGAGHARWKDVCQLFDAVRDGNREWGVPDYDGGLFALDPEISPAGALLDKVALPDTVMGLVLWHLLVINSKEGWGPVDFRSLSVREFGTVYEGLLESELSVAEVDLTTDREGYYRPCRAGETPEVKKSRIYLHNRSGARKASGTYFTKEFAVDHLLDQALEPALKDHLERLDALDETAAAEGFFDFRVADIAMGSGHFLVAAVDRIERAFSGCLVKCSLPGVKQGLERLRGSAVKELGEMAEQLPFEDTQLLRRQIARRCIYGVDLNLVAVNLGRLSIWVHTFVPGLPLSLLDHNLVHGNSLVGIGRVVEIEEKAKQDATDPNSAEQPLMFAVNPDILLGAALEPLQRLASIADVNAAEVKKARKAILDLQEAVKPAEALCDITVACRTRDKPLPFELNEWDSVKGTLMGSQPHVAALKVNEGLKPFHFPIAFPEVFLRERSGFDVIVGNPPWDKVRFEAQQFWVTRSPGLNSLPANRRDKAIEELRANRPTDAKLEQEEIALRERLQEIIDRAFNLQGRGHHGHHDLAKLFCERAIQLQAKDGCLGIVLPRTALVLGGWTDVRRAFLQNANVTTLQAPNKGGWLFDDLHQQIMVSLVTRDCSPMKNLERAVLIWPSVTSEAQIKSVDSDNALRLPIDEVGSLTDSWVIPWFSSPRDRLLFDRLRVFPRLGNDDGWISANIDSSRWDFSGSGPHKQLATSVDHGQGWRVLMTRHVDAYRITRESVFQRFIPNPEKLVPLELGVVFKGREVVIGSNHPINIFRYPSTYDNTRTLIATVLDEKGFLYSKGYVHGLRTVGATPRETLALLGYLNSFLCDWWVRRFTDRHVTLPVLKNLPLPNWSKDVREAVSGLVTSLVVRGGTNQLPGGQTLSSSPRLDDLEDVDLLVEIEKYVVEGLGLGYKEFLIALEDFSDNACSGIFREKLRKSLA